MRGKVFFLVFPCDMFKLCLFISLTCEDLMRIAFLYIGVSDCKFFFVSYAFTQICIKSSNLSQMPFFDPQRNWLPSFHIYDFSSISDSSFGFYMK